MTKPSTIREFLDLWARRADFADEIGETVARVHKWSQTGTIPARYHLRCLNAARTRGFNVSADDFALMHDPDHRKADRIQPSQAGEVAA